jgi:hypothetical protein
LRPWNKDGTDRESGIRDGRLSAAEGEEQRRTRSTGIGENIDCAASIVRAWNRVRDRGNNCFGRAHGSTTHRITADRGLRFALAGSMNSGRNRCGHETILVGQVVIARVVIRKASISGPLVGAHFLTPGAILLNEPAYTRHLVFARHVKPGLFFSKRRTSYGMNRMRNVRS